MALERKFVSINAVGDSDSCRLVALADDGTAWVAGGWGNNGQHNFGKLEWVQLKDLPSKTNAELSKN